MTLAARIARILARTVAVAALLAASASALTPPAHASQAALTVGPRAGRVAPWAGTPDRPLAAPAVPHGSPVPVGVQPPAGPVPATGLTAVDSGSIVLDGARPGPVFQGIGAISGGGGNSRLLIDYPAAERTQILDYLFTPHVGASLQLLKLEIGGGGFSSDGSEPSVEPVRGQLACGSGYEFWLARQALARNPAIKLYGLQWSAPSWVHAADGSLWSAADVGYVVDWLRCARSNGLTISYVGGWNEHFQGTPAQLAWFVALRRALDQAGFASTQIVAADQSPLVRSGAGRAPRYSPLPVWSAVAGELTHDPAFARAVSVLGMHDTCGLPVTAYQCVVAAGARTVADRTGRPLWESELGATPSTGTNPARPGPAALARAINNAYGESGVTGILVWPLVDAIPPSLPHENRGLVWASHPWDGSYSVTPLTWVIAQTTQFTAAGWRFIDGANGSLPGGGSYVSYEAPSRSAWTLVAQTSLATAPQSLTIHLTGGLPARVVHVWRTNLRGPGQFVRAGDIVPRAGAVSTVLQPGYVYTFSTLSLPPWAGRPPAAVPAAGPMPLPYTAAPDAAGMAQMLSPVEGSFGYVDGVLTQTTVGQPVEWQYVGPAPAPYAIVGDSSWHDYTVSARVLLPRSAASAEPAGAALIARFQGFHGTTVSQFRGYEFQVRSNGAWQLTATGPVPATLASGQVAAAYAYTMTLTTKGSVISARINGAQVASVISGAYAGGPAGLASLGYYPVRYLSFGVS